MSYTELEDAERPHLTKAVQWLIAINVAIYFVQLALVGPANMLGALGFQVPNLSQAWWTILTYMFVHVGLLHLVLNMYTLYLFGPRVEHVWSSGEFLRFYLVAGLGGWLFHLVLGGDGLLVGASAAVYGVTVAYAMMWPNDELLLFGVIPLKVKWMVAILVGLNVVQGITYGGNGGGVAYMAHLGGMAAAWLYMRSASSGMSLDRFKQRVSSVPDLPDETPRAVPRSAPRAREQRNDVDEIVARSNSALAQQKTEVRSTRAKSVPESLNELDAVLDKISRDGLESLTDSERQLLEEKSRTLRDPQRGR